MNSFIALITAFSVLTARVKAESHQITFANYCGHGTPKLVQGGNILSTGDPYTSTGAFESAIAFLDNGSCGANGEGCPILELTLKNGANGASSSVDISLIPSHAFTDAVGFTYTGGCDGQGAFCGDAQCKTAFFVPDDNCVQVECPADDVGVQLIWCGGESRFTDLNQTGAPCNGGSSSSSSGIDSSSSAAATSYQPV